MCINLLNFFVFLLQNLHEARLINRPNVGTTEFDIVDFIEDVNDGSKSNF